MSVLRFVSRISRSQARVLNALLTLLEYSVETIDLLYPKDDKMVICGSDTGEFASGDPKAFHEYLQKNHPEYQAYFYKALERSIHIHKRIKQIILFAPKYFRAKFLISSHPPKDFFPFISWSKRKIFINTWHGTPLKSMFFEDSSATKDELYGIMRLNKKTSVFIVSSKLEGQLIKRCFRIDSKKIQCIGHPRNDILLRTNSSQKLRGIVEDFPEYLKVILYCPTYRREGPTTFFPFKDFDLKGFNSFLKEKKLIVLVREHYYNKSSRNLFFSERIIDFGFDICADVNLILPEVDILITDYSSLYIDYLLLDRPCIFVPYDLEAYQKKRGFLIDYEFWTPGYKVQSYMTFMEALKETLSGIDVHKNVRQDLRRKFHDCQTTNSCERVFQLIECRTGEGHQ